MSKFIPLTESANLVCSDGLVVAQYPAPDGTIFYAEVVPAGWGRWWRQFLPSVGRWWFEVHEVSPAPVDKHGTRGITHAYEGYGSGGAFTLNSCVSKAQQAVEEALDLHLESLKK